ncbi:hypothetical protein PIB30_066082 [Stylosanthes scabra]|uniref:Secreted protein n=1 Tax=Stylosanthes scabra TaxID=79078 RepID=A0ABU6XK13_9FABA|nr:hypothetical protein [Stylosanthes scabra]
MLLLLLWGVGANVRHGGGGEKEVILVDEAQEQDPLSGGIRWNYRGERELLKSEKYGNGWKEGTQGGRGSWVGKRRPNDKMDWPNRQICCAHEITMDDTWALFSSKHHFPITVALRIVVLCGSGLHRA